MWAEFFVPSESIQAYHEDPDLKTPYLKYVEHGILKTQKGNNIDIRPLEKLAPIAFYRSYVLIEDDPLLWHPATEMVLTDPTYSLLVENEEGLGRKRWLLTARAAGFRP